MSGKVTFGMGLVSGQELVWDARSQSQILSDLVDVCQAVESAGIGTVLFSEHHFFDDSYLVGPSLAGCSRSANVEICVLVGSWQPTSTM
ncbi:hypothetical protein EU244_030170 [Rhodococcus qingshengii]|uniref:hypothetical protein n=1 Tax=Rhodococcus qingshengii TaxID=334542 RepID=UPI001455F187|nr:hypothetical protein [Rhodococcus qingshengii]